MLSHQQSGFYWVEDTVVHLWEWTEGGADVGVYARVEAEVGGVYGDVHGVVRLRRLLSEEVLYQRRVRIEA